MECVIETPLGNMLLQESNGSISRLSFSEEARTHEKQNEILAEAQHQLELYFSGQLQEFTLPLSPEGTDFQIKVWQELQNIAYGTTISYQEVANRLGDPKCIRAAATANGKNPIAIIIPCHRVIGSKGEMTGYAGGIKRKEALLALEKAPVMDQMNIF